MCDNSPKCLILHHIFSETAFEFKYMLEINVVKRNIFGEFSHTFVFVLFPRCM